MRKLLISKTLRGIEDVFTYKGEYNFIQLTLIPEPTQNGGQNINGWGESPAGLYGAIAYYPTFEVQMPFFEGDIRKLCAWSNMFVYERTKDFSYLSVTEHLYNHPLDLKRGKVTVSSMSFSVPNQSFFTLHVCNIFAQQVQPWQIARMMIEVRLYLDDEISLPYKKLKWVGHIYNGQGGEFNVATDHAYLINSIFGAYAHYHMDSGKGYVSIDGQGYYHDNIYSLIANPYDISSAVLGQDGLKGYPLGKIKSHFTYADFMDTYAYNKNMYELYVLE